MLTAGAIAPAVEQIASPVTGICPCSENLKFYVNYVPCNLLFVKFSTGLVSVMCVCLFLSPVPGPASGEVTRRRRQMLGRDRPAARDQPGQFCTRLLAIQT